MTLEEAQAKIEQLTTQLTEANTKADTISKDFQNYRKNSEVKEKEMSDAFTKATSEHETYKKDVETKEATRRETFLKNLIKERARGDKTLVDKITADYKLLNMGEATEEEITSRVDKATSMHTTAKPFVGDGAGGGGEGTGEGGVKNLSQNTQNILGMLGVDTNKK